MDLERVVPSVALMNNDIQVQLSCEVELLLKQLACRDLYAPSWMFASISSSVSPWNARAKPARFFLLPPLRLETVIIETSLANPGDAPAFGQFP
jgi:hypothetical protein